MSKFLEALNTVSIRYGIPVIVREESYTSDASLLDFDYIPTYGSADALGAAFSGKRIKRGLYRAANGIRFNADINGAGNILRKEYPYAFDGVDMAYVSGTVETIGGEDLLRIKKQCPPASKKAKGTAKVRHFYRGETRLWLREAFKGLPALM